MPLSLFRQSNACLLSAVLIWVLLLGGCVRPEGKEVHLQMSFWGSVEQQKVEQQIIAGFEAAHPHVKIETLPIGQRYSDKIQAMMVGNVAPDIIMVEMHQLDEWASRGALLDITEDVRAMSKGREIMPIPLKAAERDGHFFAAPVNVNGAVTYVNLSALEKAGIKLPEDGLTWDFIEKVAPKLSKRYGDPDAPTDYAILLPSPLTLVWANGGKVFDNSSHPTKAVINTPEAVRALERHRRLLQKRYAVPPDVSSDQGTYQLFRDGKVAFYFDGRWRTPDFRKIDDFKWDVYPVPKGETGKVITRHGGTFIAISAKSKHKELAREFVRYYVSGEGAKISMRGGRTIPIFRDLAYGEEFLNFRPPSHMRTFSETMEKGASKITLYAPGLMEASNIIDRRMQQLSAYPDLPVEKILSGLEVDLNRWLKKRK